MILGNSISLGGFKMDSSTSPLRPPLPPPPAAADHSWLSDSSPFLPIITVVAFIGVIVLIYAFCFAIKCPTNLSDRLHRSSGILARSSTLTHRSTNTDGLNQLVSTVAYKEAEVGNDSGGGECPVCLTAFVDGEVIREVNICKHLFHDSCIAMWLCSHSNCPVCRVFVGTTRSKPPPAAGDDDFRQGLPDSSSLV